MNQNQKTNRKIILIILITGAFFASLSQSLLSSAIPSIITEFQINASVAQWLTSAYILTLGVVCTITPYLINKYPTKNLFQASMLIFLIGSILSYISTNFITLLISRLIQGLGTGILFSLMQVMILYLYPKNEHGKALSYIGLVVGFAPSLGPTLSGIIVDLSGWRTIFQLLIIVSTITILFAQKFLPKDAGEKYTTKMDFLSAGIIALSIMLLMLAITNITTNKLTIDTITILITGIILFILFAYRQIKLEIPLLNIKLFKDRKFLIVNLIIYISFICWMSGYLLVPLLLQSGLKYTATISGLVMLPANILYAVLSPKGGQFYDKYGGKPTIIIGAILLLIGTIPFTLFNTNTTLLEITIFYILRLQGLVFMIMPLVAYAVSNLPQKEYTHGMGIINSNRQIFGALITTILIAFVTISSKNATVSTTGTNHAFTVQVILIIFSILLVGFLKD